MRIYNTPPIRLLILLAVSSTAFMTFDAAARSEYWEQRVSLFNEMPLERGDIVFLGNSITDGGEFSELLGNPKVKNRGINSDVIAGVKERLPQVTANSPSKIFLLIGINDISHDKTVDALASEYEQLVREIMAQAPGTKLYIQSVMPINNDFGRYKNLKGKEDVVKGLNNKLKEISDRNGAVYIDLWDALADQKSGKLRREYTNDGLHLLGKGYKAWISVIRHYVDE